MADSTLDACLTSYDYVFKPDILRGKVAFITGGGSGICFTVAEVFMRHQCDTVIASRNLNRLKEAAKRLETATGQRCLPLQVDVRKPEEVLRSVDQALSHYGRIDVLINGAAGNFPLPASKISFNGFKTVLDIDVMGSFNISKAVYDKYMKDHGGVIINISATLPYRGRLLQIHVNAAKAAIDSMTMTLCNEWGPQGIRVVGIAPGPIGDTEAGAGMLGEEVLKKIPLQRIGTKREVGDCAVFAASPAASYISGSTIVMDGGHWMTYENDFGFYTKPKGKL
ncbi:peroxisomal 2,4-dienoyl-CoA reductase-like [Acanthaster planci]|uniref:Peroxisomal 2,4-dienoyl-CoA reductase [(3E)-enoyl-CoA-producing] n=1 Tax=Acanthaster planci TaxID=133434 RepID=A0A8B7YMD4_ACAPL|nr:peroxisomal 2,4-dienoyl-CoA reductase-like [Acanthaster planci]